MKIKEPIEQPKDSLDIEVENQLKMLSSCIVNYVSAESISRINLKLIKRCASKIVTIIELYEKLRGF